MRGGARRSHARGCLRSTYALITLDEAKALAPEFLASVKEMAPANTMFSKGVRLAGIQAMARLRIEEGIPLALMMINLRDWGRNYITMVSLDVLKEYRGAARPALPELKKLEAQWRAEKRADFLKKLAAVVAAIESDKNPPRLISLKDHLGKDAREE